MAIPSIGATSYLDLGVGLSLNDHLRLRLNASNLLDEDPPLLADSVNSNNTDAAIYDVFGRSYQLALVVEL